MDSNKIRETFLGFFRDKQHAIVPSAPMVIKNDPTLMFTNAGMNQFKDLFLGNSPIVSPRVADTQKCLRVSGKHNDLDEVGRDTYHHTMFEMLGNWSFGDYFKKEAIAWAWELLVDVFGLPIDRIYATYFEGSPEENIACDDEAFNMWKQYLPEGHIIPGNKKDNFWEMGDTGPCGPCSEIHFDLRDNDERAKIPGRDLVNQSHPQVIEIWNLVFMQFNRKVSGELQPLPKNHVDTGMGFERLCMVLQGKKSNYDTDVFQPIITRIGEMSGIKYGQAESSDIAMRVISDHLRAISFSIADGQLPSNVKAGYVIRRILRRAVRYGYTYLGFREPFICKLVPTLVGQMGDQFPELKSQRGLIESVITEEESSFLRTLATGMTLIEEVMEKTASAGSTTISGDDAFVLYDTFGFPIDLTELIAKEKGMDVNLHEFNKRLEEQKNRSRNAASVQADDWCEISNTDETAFVGYDHLETEARITKYRKVSAKGKEYYQVVLDRTPFYGNSGGQVGDTGRMEQNGVSYPVEDTQKENNLTVHILPQLPADVAAPVRAAVDAESRQASANNHTATHLLQSALQQVLGSHVEQKGSLVTPDYLRFDFSHFQKVTDEQLRQVETIVNREIRANHPLQEVRECPIDRAREIGAMMLFGEKYGDKVRVIRFGGSTELCGGTHVAYTGQIGLFKVLSESAIAAGVRRIEACTAQRAMDNIYAVEDLIKEVQSFLNTPQIMQNLRKIVTENSEFSEQIEAFKKEKTAALAKSVAEELQPENGLVICARQLDLAPDVIKNMAFALKSELPNLVFVVGSNFSDKTSLTIMLGDDISKSGVNASNIVREAAKLIDGSGGGQPFFAVAGGKNPDGLEAAIVKATEMIKSRYFTAG